MGSLTATEWLSQSVHDLETAELLAANGRCAYAVFLAHLSVEKALKGHYVQVHAQPAPKTHNLEYLAEKNNLLVPDDLRLFLRTLSQTPILAFYPEHLEVQHEAYTQEPTQKLLAKTRELLDWIDAHISHSETAR